MARLVFYVIFPLNLCLQHVLDIGGLVDQDTERTKTAWSWFVKTTIEDEEEVELVSTNKDQVSNKRCILFPVAIMTSSMFMRFADRTGQTDLYGVVDPETPSGFSTASSSDSIG